MRGSNTTRGANGCKCTSHKRGFLITSAIFNTLGELRAHTTHKYLTVHMLHQNLTLFLPHTPEMILSMTCIRDTPYCACCCHKTTLFIWSSLLSQMINWSLDSAVVLTTLQRQKDKDSIALIGPGRNRAENAPFKPSINVIGYLKMRALM